MSTHKHIDRICAVVIVLTLLLTVLFMNGASLGLQTVIDEDAEGHSDSVYFTANDQDGDWDSSNVFSDSRIAMLHHRAIEIEYYVIAVLHHLVEFNILTSWEQVEE